VINTVLEILTNELNAYLNRKADTANDSKIVLTSVASPTKVLIPNQSLGLSLINIEEDRIIKDQRKTVRNISGELENRNPDIYLNLFVLITANYQTDTSINQSTDYKEGLKQLSHVITFFQGKNVFTPGNTPDLISPEATIERIVVELFSFSFEQMNNFWSVVGTNYLPSVLYKVRMLTIQEQDIEPAGSVEGISIQKMGMS